MKETTSIPDVIAKRLGNPGPYKLRHVGYTLALEYLRNVGIRAGKPDVHALVRWRSRNANKSAICSTVLAFSKPKPCRN